MESAEIIPVEPDPDHAGAREVETISSVPAPSGTLFYWRLTMKVTVNGEVHEHQGDGTIEALLEELSANPAHTALVINGEVVRSSEWDSTILNENDEVEMLVFVGGG